jgi:hypothetical protein
VQGGADQGRELWVVRRDHRREGATRFGLDAGGQRGLDQIPRSRHCASHHHD